MSLAVVSLCALAVAVLLSFTARINVGVLAIVFAWLVGVYFGGPTLKQVPEGFFTANLILSLPNFPEATRSAGTANARAARR